MHENPTAPTLSAIPASYPTFLLFPALTGLQMQETSSFKLVLCFCNHPGHLVKQRCQPGTMPDHIFFDSNCQLSKIVQDGPAFKNVGLSVDVFHFKSKHKTTDVFCQANCNPVDFSKMEGLGNKAWYFNSLIAEQTNVWFGSYHSMCREMLVDKYNFFLDEMILCHNHLTYNKLALACENPKTFM